MKLLAISDLHVGFPPNWAAVQSIQPRPEDWLILAGDIADTEQQLAATLDVLSPRFRQLVWVPGNHELWSPSGSPLRGQARYARLIALCRERGVLTPEDAYPVFPDPENSSRHYRIIPMFLLYDYSFRPAHVSQQGAVAWALEHDLLCADEVLLHPDPYSSKPAWCHARCDLTEARISALRLDDPAPTILINHFPLRPELAHTPAIPRFSIWCGTRRTEQYHKRFGATAVISGHLHIRSSRVLDGVRFEEVSLGYPRRQWHPGAGIERYIRQILPPPDGSGR